MSECLIFCCDLARRDPAGNAIERIEGWCICSRKIRALMLARGDEFEFIPYGFERPDVAMAYPDFPGGVRSGFRLTTYLLPNDAARLCVEFEGELHLASVNFGTRDVQTIALDETTRLTGDDDLRAQNTLAKFSDVELRLHNSLGHKRGLTLRLDLINKCNLRCVMCHFSEDAIFKRPTRQLNAEQFRMLFDQVGPHVREVMLSCGDEPLTAKFLPEILRYLASEHPEVAVEFCTNATLMRAPVRRLIMETGVARIAFSLDAVSKKILEQIRVGCRYEQLLGNIIALRDLKEKLGAPRPGFVFNFVMMERNIHEAPAFVRMAKLLGAETIDFRHVVPIEPWFEPEQLLSLHQAKFNFYRAKIVAEAEAQSINYYLPPPFPTDEIFEPAEDLHFDLSEFLSVKADGEGDLTSSLPEFASAPANRKIEGTAVDEFAATFCNRPFSEIMIRDQEDILPCPWHGRPLGKLSEGKTLSEVFFGNEFQRLRENMLRPEGDPFCAGCPLKSGHLPTEANT